jgi:hypothetical protein
MTDEHGGPDPLPSLPPYPVTDDGPPESRDRLTTGLTAGAVVVVLLLLAGLGVVLAFAGKDRPAPERAAAPSASASASASAVSDPVCGPAAAVLARKGVPVPAGGAAQRTWTDSIGTASECSLNPGTGYRLIVDRTAGADTHQAEFLYRTELKAYGGVTGATSEPLPGLGAEAVLIIADNPYLNRAVVLVIDGTDVLVARVHVYEDGKDLLEAAGELALTTAKEYLATA